MAENGTVAVVTTLPPCDICKMHGEPDVPAQFDGATTSGPWANMCITHFTLYGVGLGTGRGQRLIVKQPEKVSLTDDGKMIAFTTPECTMCGKTTVVELTRTEFRACADPMTRPRIDLALPDRDLDFRELIQTGIHPECWDQIMDTIEDDPDEDLS